MTPFAPTRLGDRTSLDGRRDQALLQNASASKSDLASNDAAPPAMPRQSSVQRIASRLSGTDAKTGVRKRDFGLIPIPKRCRYEPSMRPEECFPWTIRKNLIFAICSTVSVANLYYNQPMLVKIAEDFGTDHNHVSQVTTLVQAGYACGIFFISPMGDLVRRRQLLILLMALGAIFSIGCALARSVEMLVGFSFITGLVTVTPQLMIPWTADLAPARIRARSMAITLSGLILGLSLGRVLGGIISNFASWRDTYWLAVGLQGFAVFLEYWTLPDTPDKGIGLSYPAMLYSMVSYYFKYPTLVQACLSLYCNSCVFAGYWTVQTFLLSSTYSFTSLSIGLMGLLGFVGAVVAPFSGKLVDAVVPWLAQLIGLSLSFSGMLIALFTAERSVVAVAISVTMFDVGNQLFQVSSSYRVAGLDPKARARLNGCVLLALFAGQTSGTAILTHIYNAHGWHPTGCTAVGLMSLSLLFLFARGPHEHGWIGWRGGASLRKRKVLGANDGPDAITEGARATGKTRRAGRDQEVGGGSGEGGEAVPMPLVQGEKAVDVASGGTYHRNGPA